MNDCPDKEAALPAPPQFSIRAVCGSDAPAIARLWLNCTSEVAACEPIYQPGIGEEALAGMLREDLEAARKFGWIAEIAGRMAGYVVCRMEDENPVFTPRRFIHVIDLDVAREFRRRGLSRALMDCVEGFARAQGIRRLELSVVHAEGRARQVWERHGFHPHLITLHKDLP